MVAAALVEHLDLRAGEGLLDHRLQLCEIGSHRAPKLLVRRAASCGLEHLVDQAVLDARAALPLTGGDLGPIDRLPAGEADGVGLALAEKPSIGSSTCRSGMAPAARSSKIELTVSFASFLLVPITPLGPRLIQPDGVHALHLFAGLWVAGAPVVVRDRSGALVERATPRGHALVADRAENQAAFDLLALPGIDRAHATVLFAQLVPAYDDRFDLPVTANLDRGGEEAQDDPLRLARRLALGVVGEESSRFSRELVGVLADSR